MGTVQNILKLELKGWHLSAVNTILIKLDNCTNFMDKISLHKVRSTRSDICYNSCRRKLVQI